MDNQYIELVEGLNAGDLARRLNDELSEVVAAVQNTGLKGSIALNLAIERKNGGQIKIVPKVTSKAPKEEPDAGLRYVTDSGQLLEQDPNQPEFSFKTVTPIEEGSASGG